MHFVYKRNTIISCTVINRQQPQDFPHCTLFMTSQWCLKTRRIWFQKQDIRIAPFPPSMFTPYSQLTWVCRVSTDQEAYTSCSSLVVWVTVSAQKLTEALAHCRETKEVICKVPKLVLQELENCCWITPNYRITFIQHCGEVIATLFKLLKTQSLCRTEKHL